MKVTSVVARFSCFCLEKGAHNTFLNVLFTSLRVL